MRRGIALFLLAVVCVLGLLVHQVWSLLALLVVDGRQDAIMKEDVPSSEFTEASPPDGQLIPKILHQTYKNASIPERWQGPQQSCIDLHSDWDYYLWTDDKAREFIAAEYVVWSSRRALGHERDQVQR